MFRAIKRWEGDWFAIKNWRYVADVWHREGRTLKILFCFCPFCQEKSSSEKRIAPHGEASLNGFRYLKLDELHSKIDSERP